MVKNSDLNEEEDIEEGFLDKYMYMIIMGLIAIIVIGAISYFTFYPDNDTTEDTIESSIGGSSCKNIQVAYEEQEEYIKTEYYTETVPYTEEECEDIDLAYSVTNEKWVTSSCLDYDKKCDSSFLGIATDCTDFCVKRTLTYSANVRNLEPKEKGIWGSDTSFSIDNKFYKKKTSRTQIYPQTIETVVQSITLISDSPTGVANKGGRRAGFSISEIPTKRVCKDVTKYKEVQREKKVTAYRPITKYRNKKVCD